MTTIERTDYFYELDCATVDAEGHHCAECGDTAPGEKLFEFFSVREGSNKIRRYTGRFCSKDCYERYNGLKNR